MLGHASKVPAVDSKTMLRLLSEACIRELLHEYHNIDHLIARESFVDALMKLWVIPGGESESLQGHYRALDFAHQWCQCAPKFRVVMDAGPRGLQSADLKSVMKCSETSVIADLMASDSASALAFNNTEEMLSSMEAWFRSRISEPTQQFLQAAAEVHVSLLKELYAAANRVMSKAKEVPIENFLLLAFVEDEDAMGPLMMQST